MIEGEITITPQAWGPPGAVKFHYISPDGSLWNVDRVIGNYVQLWTVNAWGAVHPDSVSVQAFRATWRENV